MYRFVVVALFLGLACADHINKDAETVNLKNDAADAEGNFAYSFDTTNGISVQQSGDHVATKGSADWVSPEGEKITLQYTADENGYQASGSYVPEIPAAILRSLEYIRTHPSAESSGKQF